MKKFLSLVICSCLLFTACATSTNTKSTSDNTVTKTENDNDKEETDTEEDTEEDIDNTEEIKEENETIINTLNNMYNYDTMDKPVIKYIPETNTYAVIAVSNEAASVFDTMNSTNQWDSYVSDFQKLSNTALSLAHNHDESANISTILAIKASGSDSYTLHIPMITVENGNITYNIYDSEKSDRMKMVLATTAYETTLGKFNIIYDDNTNTYSIEVISYYFTEKLPKDNWDELSKTFADYCSAEKDIIQSLDSGSNSNITLKFLDNKNNELWVCENGTITYDCKNK